MSTLRKPYLFLALLTVAVAGFNLWLQYRPVPPDPRVLPDETVDSTVDYSNILPADYVGPASCADCHQKHYHLWSQHPHRRMNQLANPESVKGNFNNVLAKFPIGDVLFSRDGEGKYHMTVLQQGQVRRHYEVTRTVGSRFMQFYIGKQLKGPEPEGHAIYQEHMLPFSFWFKLQRWLPRQYFDADGEEKLHHGLPQVEALTHQPEIRSYTAVCMNCHNTFPYAYRIFNPSFVGFPDATVAATLKPLSEALAGTVDVKPSVESFFQLNAKLEPEKHLVTLGISCESCHFGGREHAENEKKIRFLPTSPYTRVIDKREDRHHTSDRKNPVTVLGVCVQCHSGNARLYPNGAAQTNSREGLDFHRGFCTTKMKCTHCHEPHTAGEPSGGPTNPRHLATCTSCHPRYQDKAFAQAHSQHPVGANVNCLDCHMPRYTQGLDELIRTHRICHPVEEPMVAAGSANACNLCHLDKSTRWTLNELEKGWGKKLEPKKEWASFEQLDQPVGEMWLKSKNSHLRLVATQSYARSPLGKKKLPDLIRSLNDPEPLNRVFHSCAVQKICGQPASGLIPVDITAAPADRKRQIEAWLQQLAHGEK